MYEKTVKRLHLKVVKYYKYQKRFLELYILKNAFVFLTDVTQTGHLFLLFFFLDKKEPKNQDLLDLSGYSSRKKRTQPKLDAPKWSQLRTVRCFSPFFTLRSRRQF